MAIHRRVCPSCRSAAVQPLDRGWRCDRCGATARDFPEAHAERDRGPDALQGVRDHLAGGYQRRRTFLD